MNEPTFIIRIGDSVTFNFDVSRELPPPAPSGGNVPGHAVLVAKSTPEIIIGNAIFEEIIPSYSGGTA